MLIDWFTVAAPALNFLMLVWLMKRFLYKPILNAIDAREKRIAAELADAAAQKSEAREERAEFQKKNEDFDAQRATLLSEATEDANTERLRLQGEAREAAEELRDKLKESQRNEARDLNQTMSRATRDEAFAIARMALEDLASTSLEESMSDAFVERLRSLDDEGKERLSEAMRTASDPAVLRSAFELPELLRNSIETSVHETLSGEVPIRFETAAGLIAGIEFSINGQRVAWNVEDYLGALEKTVSELLGKRDAGAPNSKNEIVAVPEGKASEHSV